MVKINLSNLRGDFTGGLTAGIVALPLALALGVASGLGPMAGLYGAIAVASLPHFSVVHQHRFLVQRGLWLLFLQACSQVYRATPALYSQR